MKKRTIIILISILAIAVLYFVFAKNTVQNSEPEIVVTAKKGDFVVDISTTGELEAKNSVEIMGPLGLRRARIYNVKIDKMVDEGTKVKKGDFIASLDKSDLNERLNERMNELEQRESDYTQTRLDTAIQLRKLRDELVNKQYDVEEKKLVLEQSKFEPPATIKQNELNLEKSKRAYEQAKENYELERKKAIAEMRKARARYVERKVEVEFLQSLLGELQVTAPEAGMVIYTRGYRGGKIKEGDMISTWYPIIAELPDLSKMISQTFVNEVDIRKIKKGQKVNISLDAFPDKHLTGSVITVANVGEQKPNSDAKVFQVDIEVNESDTTLRPGMTTGNTIISDVVKDALFVPLECLHSQGDTLTYVFKKSGIATVRQEVKIGRTNSNEAVVKRGLEEGDKLLLSLPSDVDNKKLVLLEEAQQSLTSNP